MARAQRCDRWFASVPGSTLPNRPYALCGVAAGTRDDRPPRDALLQQASVRAAQAGTGDPGARQREEGDRQLNDLQQRILAATRELGRRGHPPDTP